MYKSVNNTSIILRLVSGNKVSDEFTITAIIITKIMIKINAEI